MAGGGGVPHSSDHNPFNPVWPPYAEFEYICLQQIYVQDFAGSISAYTYTLP
jgi:hypothetical protein